ncbi:Multiple C2 and transmembrane domain-containing protein 1, partial [Dufourea novaeangliae]
DNSRAEERSRLNLNGSRQLSKSATELRNNDNSSPSRHGEQPDSGVVHHHRHHRHAASVAQRTHTFFATLKSRWSRSRSKERKKSKDAGTTHGQDASCKGTGGAESDYAADYSSEHSKSSSATQSPARHCLNHPESPLARGGRQTVVTRLEDSPGKCSEAHSKGSLSFQASNDEARGSIGQDDNAFLHEEVSRRRELALRQHAFFQLRLHIRRGTNLVAMDRCGASDPYVKVKCSGRLLHKSRTVHRDLNPVWDESVTLPIEDPFQLLTIKVFDYDWGLQDDFMGAAQLDLTQLDLGQPQDVVLELKDPARPKQDLGEIYLTATLWPRNQQEKEQKLSETEDESEDRVNDGSTEIEGEIDPELVVLRPARRLFKKRDKVSDIIAGEASIHGEDHSSRSSRSFKVIREESVENKWTRFWETHRDRFTQKSNDNGRSEEETDAILRKAIWHARFDSSEDRRYGFDGKSDDENNRLDGIRSTESESTPGRSKITNTVGDDRDASMKIDEGKTACSQNDSEKVEDVSKCFSHSFESNCLVGSENDGKCQAKRTIDRSKELDPSSRKWSSLESLRTRDPGGSCGSRIEGLSIEKPIVKEKRTIESLKSSFGKKIGSVERILEGHVEKILEENVEKHPWLSSIENWIVDRRIHSFGEKMAIDDRRNNAATETTTGSANERSRIEPPDFEIKFTAAANEHEEPKIECRVENPKKIRRAVSPKPVFDAAHLIARLKKSEFSTTREDTNMTRPEGFVEVKDARHPDLFDKLRDNVKEKMEDIHRYFQRTNRLADVNRRLKSQIWSSVVTIVLVEAKNLLPMDIDGLSDPYVKFRLGTEKYKSKVVHKTLNPVWLEQFDLHLYEDPYLGQELEVTVWDRDKSHQDDMMGRTVINLAILERETTHRLWRDLEDGSGNIFLLLTISGTTASETISDLAAHEDTPREREQLYQRYSMVNTLQRIRDVGHLTVKVFKAQGLAAADLGGKSDPFCVLELVNSRLQTQTEYKTLAPNWQKIFTFNVKDINAVLEVTVYDEDRDHKVEFLGKVAIPLLRIRNGEKRWYALKDKKLRGRAKGNSPQILLELTVVWNFIRACVRTLNPREKKYMEPEIKFKRQVFLRNVLRLKAIIIIFIDIGKYIQSCWEWESKMRSIFAFVLFIFGCYYFEPYMIPGAALLILLKYYLVAVITGTPLSHNSGSHFHDDGDDGPTTPGDDDDDDDDKDKEEKKSLKERLQAIQEVTQTVQNSIGYIASLCERVKNLFNFTVPYLSYVAIVLVILGAAVLYFIPVRYLILAWGVNKFFRKIIRPHSVPNNEVLDLISRVPDDEELLNYRELKPLPTADCEKAGTSGSPGASSLTRREQRKRQKAA